MAAGRRSIGRILSLGFPLPGPLVDNYNFLTAPSFFDYDAIVVDPGALSRLIEALIDGSTEAETYGGSRVRNVAVPPAEVPLASVLLRRRAETEALLAHGGAVICFATPATIHERIDGAAALDDYYWLPDDLVRFVTACMTPADGARVRITDYEHPLAAFVEGQLAEVTYRACFDGAAARDARARVFAESAGGVPVAVELPARSGRVIFLPAIREPGGDLRYAMSDALQAGIRRVLGVMAEGRAPGWAEGRSLPGLDERQRALDAARQARDTAQAALAAAEEAYDELARFRRLLWQEGAFGLDAVVVDALRLLGFDLYAGQRADIELRTEAGAVFVEIDAGEGAVGMAAHHRLRQRIERAIEERGQAPRGLLVVNGYRLEPPDERAQQVTDAVRLAAETLRYCIATTASLFDAVAAQLAGDQRAVEVYRERLATTNGLLTAERAPGAAVAPDRPPE
ncbi:MAG: hypothetical protein KGK07_01365 [Chloroflexota bacterium]|nr:hypothetical protein [Chloroflexota bacterium]